MQQRAEREREREVRTHKTPNTSCDKSINTRLPSKKEREEERPPLTDVFFLAFHANIVYWVAFSVKSSKRSKGPSHQQQQMKQLIRGGRITQNLPLTSLSHPTRPDTLHLLPNGFRRTSLSLSLSLSSPTFSPS